jgi:predicted ATPase
LPRTDLPSGTVTFLFTDVEGSTRLLHELGAEGYSEALAEHRRIIREACAAEGGVEVDTQGDAFFFAFPTAPGALGAAAAFTEALASGRIQARVGLHTGTPLLTDEGYVGDDVHRAARIAAAGSGGQVLVSASTAALAELELLDLGEHRFKDLLARERVFQLGEGDFAPLKTLFQTNLPIPVTPFLGREQELREVLELLVRDDVRLLTLTGSGGTGKTRLAVQAAAGLGERYEHGVWWVPLASLADAELVLEQAAQSLSARGGLQAHIADKRMLVLFDNFETVVAAGPEVAGLVAACPNLDVLVTSREPLRVAAEREYPVHPLTEADSVALFLARARAARPDFEANGHIAEICRRLDHLPLAVELAAARARVLPPTQLLEHLDSRLPLLTGGSRDIPERHRTLRATIAWSYDLLSDHEQWLFARLSVFAGCTLAAAEHVCGADLDTVQALVEKSLLRQARGRYWMLETIREFALERLEATGAGDTLRDGHAAHFADLADCRWPELMVADSEWRVTVDTERRNLQGALEWSLARGHGEDALAIVSGIWLSWVDQRQARQWAERVLSLPSLPVSERRAHVLGALGEAAEAQGDLAEAKRAFEHALALCRELDEPRWVAAYLAELADVALAERDSETARRLAEESAAIRRELVGESYLSRPLLVLSDVALAEEDLGQAWDYLESAAQHVRADDAHILSSVIERRGEVLRRRGEYRDALGAFGECLHLARRHGEPRMALEALDGVAAVWEATGRPDDAARLAGTVERFREESGLTSRLFGQPVPARVEPAWSDGRALSFDDALDWVLDALD